MAGRRGDGIYLRGSTWMLDIVHNGQRHVKKLGKLVSRTVAKELAQVERAKMLKGEAGIGGKKPKDLSFETAVEEFLKWAQANKRPNTVISYRCSTNRLSESLKGLKLSQIHPFLVEKHKQARLAQGCRVAVNRELTCLKTLFNKMIDWGKFEGTNPARKVKKIDEPLNRLRYLSQEEETRLLAAASEPLRTIILVGLHTGLRIHSEVLTLQWENVDLARKQLTVEAAYAKNKETATIPINSTLLEALNGLSKCESGYLFLNHQGKPFKSIRSAFTTACKHAKLQDVTPHTLRHTFASKLGMSSANDRTLQALGRWKEPKMIQRYTHLSQEHLVEAVERIADHFPSLVPTSKIQSA